MSDYKGSYQTFGRTTVEKRHSCPLCFRYVLRLDFVDESSFAATVTVEDRPTANDGSRTMYVCIALSQKPGNGHLTRMIADTRQYFKDEGYTHAEYVIDKEQQRIEL
ncbi:hypothetical protein [Neptunomonas japonica]|uniref:Uncharacterized protein n=1 Tax=Neptunomonas japonica JAMM 1380 TaxID=1441457 RepID=A0A7R6SVF4_9GAMM|nr:hypothetical protein [Neptunomonas japonica]BBB29365.1 hypothetical protein NEJAP_1413 [Neptunomonas japonica JAMM 1380]